MSTAHDLRLAFAEAALAVIQDLKNETASWTNKSNTAITVYVDPGPASLQLAQDLGLDAEETARLFTVPGQAGLLAIVAQKALTTNVVTLTTRAAHGFVASQRVLVELDPADTSFDGEFLISTVPSTTTLTYAKTASNVTAASARGVVGAFINAGDKLTWRGSDWEVRRVNNPDGLGAVYELDCVRVQAVKIGGF